MQQRTGVEGSGGFAIILSSDTVESTKSMWKPSGISKGLVLNAWAEQEQFTSLVSCRHCPLMIPNPACVFATATVCAGGFRRKQRDKSAIQQEAARAVC